MGTFETNPIDSRTVAITIQAIFSIADLYSLLGIVAERHIAAIAEIPLNYRKRPGTDIQDLVHNLLTFMIAQREAIKFNNLVMRRKMHYDNRNNLNLMSWSVGTDKLTP